MSACAFFGHRNFGYGNYAAIIKNIVTELIEREGVDLFYNGYRGDFDRLCAGIVYELKGCFKTVKNVMALSYLPASGFVLPKFFDESVYLPEKPVPAKYAIAYTNKLIVDKSEFIVSGVARHGGGAFAACDYARRKNKKIINIFG